jgi:hypothetical protein
MPGSLRWRFEVTRDALPALQQHLEWALQRQNQRLARAIPTGRLSIARRQRLVFLLSPIGVVAVLGLYLSDPRAAGHGPLYLLGGAFFVGTFAAGLALPAVRRWSARTAGTMIERRAARMLRTLARRAPCAIEYELDEEELRAARAALYTDSVVVLLRRLHSPAPLRVLWVATTSERQALLAALEAAGVACEEVTGAVDGYVAPVPEARARRRS